VIVGLIVAAVLAGALVGHGMGVRAERGRHARYTRLTTRGEGLPRDGVRLRRIRISR